MHIAVTGVSGFIGAEIARQLKAGGHTVTGLVRETSKRDHIEGVDKFVVGDHADESCWDELLGGADCVVHNSADWRAKIAELGDHTVYALGQVVSGHTLKHLLTAAAVFVLVRMLRLRVHDSTVVDIHPDA